MKTEIRVLFNDEEINNLERVKKHYSEKTRKKALVRMMEYFILNVVDNEKSI